MDFKIGDRVVLAKSYTGVSTGEKGTIQHICGNGRNMCDIYVRWDSYNSIRHNNEGRCEAGHGWRVSYWDIEPERVGDLGDLPEPSSNVLDLFGC